MPSAGELEDTSDWFFKDVITTFSDRLCEPDEAEPEDTESDVDTLFLCQCFYESQCPGQCISLLENLDYRLDLSEQSLDLYSCCAVAYVVSQSKERKISLNLGRVTVSDQGMRRLFGCFGNVQWRDPLPRQLWEIFLLSETSMDHTSLLQLDGNQLHLPVEGKRRLFEGAVEVMQKITTKVNVCLYWDRETPVSQSLCESLLEALPLIGSLSFRKTYTRPGLQDEDRRHGTLEREERRLLLELFLKAALLKEEQFHSVVKMLLSLFSVDTDLHNIQMDFYQHVQNKGCSSVLPALRTFFQSAPSVWVIDLSERKASILLEVLKLQPQKKQVELRGWSHEEREGRSFLQCLPYISQLRLSNNMVLLLLRWVRRGRLSCPLATEELSLAPEPVQPSQRVTLKLVSSLASLLRQWTVRRLDLTEFCVPTQCLITLLLHDAPLTIQLSPENVQQLLDLLHEVQDKALTLSFLTKVGGDLTSCSLTWELLHYVLQQSSAQTITVNLRKNQFLQESVTRLLPFLDRISFKRSCPSFVKQAITEVYKAHASQLIPSLLRSFDQVISLTCRELDSVDCAAVLSVDRNLLLRFIHCCAACDAQQEAASGLLRTTQHRLDLSCSSCVEMSEQDQTETLRLTANDCRAVSTILRHSSQDIQLDLRDCEVEDHGLDLLFPVLDRVRLRASKAVILQLVSLVPVISERDTVRRAVSLCEALGGELDLSHTTLDQRACGALARMLEFSEGLTELDLSHCQLTDQLLLTLITHLHKVQVLDLSHNKITDVSTAKLLQLVSINPSTETVRLFRNNIMDTAAFQKHRHFEIC